MDYLHFYSSRQNKVLGKFDDLFEFVVSDNELPNVIDGYFPLFSLPDDGDVIGFGSNSSCSAELANYVNNRTQENLRTALDGLLESHMLAKEADENRSMLAQLCKAICCARAHFISNANDTVVSFPSLIPVFDLYLQPLLIALAHTAELANTSIPDRLKQELDNGFITQTKLKANGNQPLVTSNLDDDDVLVLPVSFQCALQLSPLYYSLLLIGFCIDNTELYDLAEQLTRTITISDELDVSLTTALCMADAPIPNFLFLVNAYV